MHLLRLDLTNSVFAGLPLLSSIKRLQRFQNAAARMLTHSKIRKHITQISSLAACIIQNWIQEILLLVF